MENLKLYDINLFGLILEYTTNEEFSRLYQDKEIKNYIHNNEWLLKNRSNIKIFKSDKIYEKGKIKDIKFICNQGKCRSLVKNLYYHKNLKCDYRMIKCFKCGRKHLAGLPGCSLWKFHKFFENMRKNEEMEVMLIALSSIITFIKSKLNYIYNF